MKPAHALRTACALVMIVATAASVPGCADERDPIDRVQPYALLKSYFVGEDLVGTEDDPEFWTQGTLVDVGYGAAQDGLFTSTYAQPMSRLRWQITEDMLFGRLAYERVDGTDGRGLGGPTQDGVIVVAYPIEKHFDIVRAYNPTTGEQLNIIEENTVDRPWYEREYMRVDWSRNMNTDSYDFDTLSLVGIYGGITYTPLAYDVTDPNDPNAPVFDLENGYFDVTNRAYAQPEQIDLSHFGWGIDSFPACYLDNDFLGGSYPAGDCNPVELTIRQSFRRVVDSDYEPRDWDGFRFQAYGGFYNERYGYARNYGMSDDLWRRFINQQQIWERSHFYANPEAMSGALECYTPDTTPFGADPHRDEDGNGTEDECESAGPGSRCDTFRQRCTLPYTRRTPKTLVWYYTQDSHPDYYAPTDEAVHQWDIALRTAVRAAQYAECTRLGTDRDTCRAQFPIFAGQMDDYQDAIWLANEVDACRRGGGDGCDALAATLGAERDMSDEVVSIAQMDEMIVLCHSPVEAGDHEACGDRRLPEGVSADECGAAYDEADPDEQLIETCRAAINVRRGDLRYHQVNVIADPQTPSPWGIMVDSIDPFNGETVAASINVWAHVNDLFGQGVIDKLRYLAGELSTEDVTNGENVRQWALAAQAASGAGALPMMTRRDIHERMSDFARGEVPEEGGREVPEAMRAQIRELNRELRQTRASTGVPSSTSAVYEARRARARGTEFEAELMTPMIQQLHGVQSLPLTDAVMDRASPLRGGNPSFQRQMEHMRENALGHRGACILHADEAQAPFSLTGLSEVLQEKFGAFDPSDPIDVQQERAERMRFYVSQRAHFSVMTHEIGHSIGLRHNFVSSSNAWQYRPQYWQLRTRNGAVTRACTDLAEDGAECVGPRYYDPVTDEERDNLIWMWMHSSVMDYAGELTQDMIGLGVYDFAAARMLHGDTVAVMNEPGVTERSRQGQLLVDQQDTFGGILGIEYTLGDDEIHYSQLQTELDLIDGCYVVEDPEIFKPSTWNEARDGAWSPLLDGLMVNVGGQWTRCRQQQVDYVAWDAMRSDGQGPVADSSGRVRMPYGFATDRWADLGNLSVYRHDNGADAYEIFNFMITSQEVYHIFDAYRRGRQTFSVRSAASRSLHRFNAKLRDGAKGLGLIKNIYRDFALHQGYDFDTFWPIVTGFFPENVLASGLAFDHITRSLARPESGDHWRPEHEDILRSARDTTGSPGSTLVTIPTGASGYEGSLGMGGSLVENQLCDDCGEYDSEFTMNAGSYYDKANTAMLLTESVDNFISSSRTDFVDPRYRAVSLADLFPEGYRRWLANNLTGDDFIKGPRVAANAGGRPLTDTEGYPAQPIGFTSWWGDEARSCFPADGTTLCSSLAPEHEGTFDPRLPENTAVVDPQVGWEQQKFLIAWTMLYLFENQETNWLDMLRLWEAGHDDPGFPQRIELHTPTGRIYVAKTFGTETLFGETVQRGIAARVLEYANELVRDAYETTDGPDLNGDGTPDWYLPVYSPATGLPIVRWDPSIAIIDDEGLVRTRGVEGCNEEDNSECTCTSNRACVALGHYLSVPAYLREAVSAYGLGEPESRGIYD